MFFGNKRRRRPQSVSAPVQALEAREMKSATASYDGNNLTIQGTESDDYVTYDRFYRFWPGEYVNQVRSNGALILEWKGAAPANLNASMSWGNDTLLIRGDSYSDPIFMYSVNIDTGTRYGSLDKVSISRVNTAVLTIRSGASVASLIDLSEVTSRLSTRIETSQPSGYSSYDYAYPNFSTDQVKINNSKLGSFTLNTGAGADYVKLSTTRASSTYIDLGQGNDALDVYNPSLGTITINGGGGLDSLRCNTLGFVTYTSGSLFGPRYQSPVNFESVTYLDQYLTP